MTDPTTTSAWVVTQPTAPNGTATASRLVSAARLETELKFWVREATFPDVVPQLLIPIERQAAMIRMDVRNGFIWLASVFIIH